MEDAALQLEQQYIAGGMTLKELAEQTGTPISSLKKWSRERGWAKKRQRFRDRAMKIAVTRAVNRKAKELSVLIEASGVMEQALLKAAKQFDNAIKDDDSAFVTGQFKARNLLSIAEGIERMTHARNMMGAGMSQAEFEKLQLLKRKMELEEEKQAKASGAEGVQIVLAPEIDELLEEKTDADAGNGEAER